jgi:hypothetical protein
VVPPPGTNTPPPRRRGEGTFVQGSISPGTNAPPHLYHMLCTGSIPGTNEGYEQVQMTVFPEVLVCFPSNLLRSRSYIMSENFIVTWSKIP